MFPDDLSRLVFNNGSEISASDGSNEPLKGFDESRPRSCARLEALTDMADDMLDDDDEKEDEAPEPFQVMQQVLTGIDVKNRCIGLVMLPQAKDDKGGPRPTFLLREKDAVDFIAHLQYLLRRLSQRPL